MPDADGPADPDRTVPTGTAGPERSPGEGVDPDRVTATPADDSEPTVPRSAPSSGGEPPSGALPPTGVQTPHPPRDYGRAGRNLPVAIGVGVGIAVAVIAFLLFFKPGFVAVVAIGLVLASVELHQNFARRGVHSSIVPIVVGTIMIVVGIYVAGVTRSAGISNIALLLAALALTVIASLVWRMPKGADGYLADVTASLFIIAYIPLLGSFVALLLAGDQGSGRVVAFVLTVVMADVGGYAAGVMFGKHPMAPTISPKKSWEGFAGSLVLGTAAAVVVCVLGLQAPFWVGLVLGPCLVVTGVIGDLVESLIKRDLGIKDMSSFLPGHGGVMDRIDSLLLAAPVGWLILLLLVPGG